MPREHYVQQLRSLQDDLLRLAGLAEAAVGRAVTALQNQDVEEARRIIAEDDIIDRQQYALEDRALLLIARQAPMAVDLRTISAVISIASELERIGDYAEGLAAVVVRTADLPVLEPPPLLEQMATEARMMLRNAIDAIVARDATAAEQMERADDQVDELYSRVLRELLGVMRDHPDLSESATYLLWAAHNLERIADRTVNIAERAVFIATGTLAPVRPEHGPAPV